MIPASATDAPENPALPEAIRSYFRYRVLGTDRKYRQWIKSGKKSMIIALVILAVSTCPYLHPCPLLKIS